MNGNWYVLRKGKLYKVRSCVQHGYRVVATCDSRQHAISTMYKAVGNALCLTTYRV